MLFSFVPVPNCPFALLSEKNPSEHNAFFYPFLLNRIKLFLTKNDIKSSSSCKYINNAYLVRFCLFETFC
jgi:hypothetical protein